MSEFNEPRVSEVGVPQASAAKADSAAEAELRYLKVLDGLVDDASEQRRMEVLADVLAWTAAHIIYV